MTICAIIFDFDGVILESVSVKTEAFRTLFSFVPEYVEDIVKIHIENGGMSRYEKFRYIFKNIIKQELTQQKFDELSDTFSKIVFDEVIKAKFVPGAQEFLENNYSKIPLYIVSATPEEELIQIIHNRRMFHYFKKVFGAPNKKTACIREIIKTTGYSLESVIFIGDAKNDCAAAQAAGVRFIGRVKEGDENRFAELSSVEVVIQDLHELSRYMELHQ